MVSTIVSEIAVMSKLIRVADDVFKILAEMVVTNDFTKTKGDIFVSKDLRVTNLNFASLDNVCYGVRATDSWNNWTWMKT